MDFDQLANDFSRRYGDECHLPTAEMPGSLWQRRKRHLEEMLRTDIDSLNASSERANGCWTENCGITMTAIRPPKCVHLTFFNGQPTYLKHI